MNVDQCKNVYIFMYIHTRRETVVDISLINVILCCTSGEVDVSIQETESNLLGFKVFLAALAF